MATHILLVGAVMSSIVLHQFNSLLSALTEGQGDKRCKYMCTRSTVQMTIELYCLYRVIRKEESE